MGSCQIDVQQSLPKKKGVSLNKIHQDHWDNQEITATGHLTAGSLHFHSFSFSPGCSATLTAQMIKVTSESRTPHFSLPLHSLVRVCWISSQSSTECQSWCGVNSEDPAKAESKPAHPQNTIYPQGLQSEADSCGHRLFCFQNKKR